MHESGRGDAGRTDGALPVAALDNSEGLCIDKGYVCEEVRELVGRYILFFVHTPIPLNALALALALER